jgi:N-acetylglucosaminyl-diphospho-decaprenol L-rhamnosyltransferase
VFLRCGSDAADGVSWGHAVSPSLDVIVVNWNSGGALGECLASVAVADYRSIALRRVVVVDNASNDKSVECSTGFDLPVTVVRNSYNLGFARACNQGARLGDADYLLFLNPDVCLSASSLVAPVVFLEQNRHIGICGIRLVDGQGGSSTSCARLPRPRNLLCQIVGFDRIWPRLFPPCFLSAAELRVSRPVEQVSGACFFVRRQVYDLLNGFDERYFMYYEEVDFSLRARCIGYTSYYLSTSSAVHRGGGCSEGVRGRRLFYLLESRLAFAMKQFSRPAFLCVLGATLLLEPWIRVIRACFRGAFDEVRHTLEAYTALYPSVVRGQSLSSDRVPSSTTP